MEIPDLFKWLGAALALACVALTIIKAVGWATFSWWWVLAPIAAMPILLAVIAAVFLAAWMADGAH